ncbi:MAG TPA: substrate-binding domain-containing protein [Pseudomonadota bacterium]|nr:substrate-binding domain-containing protein [Pseudomonadota bacterium]
MLKSKESEEGNEHSASSTPGKRERLLLVVASLLLSVLIGVLLSRQGRTTETKAQTQDRVRIGLSFDTLKEERWQRDRAAFVAKAQALGASVMDLSANSSDTQQMKDVESLLTAKVNVLVIVAHNGAAMSKAVRLAHAAGVPVIAYDRLIPEPSLDFYISFDAVAVGEKQARYLVERLPTKGPVKVLRLHGAKTDHNAHLMKEGQDRVLVPLVQSGAIEVVHEDWVDDWKPEHAKRIVNAAIARGLSFFAILAPNDGTAAGSIQALREDGRDGKVLVTGQDAELSACQRIAAGSQTMTVYKPLHRLAGQAAQVAVAMAKGKPVVARSEILVENTQVPAVFIEVLAVDKTNLEKTVVADGFHPLEALQHP